MNLNDDSARFDIAGALKRFSGDEELLEEAIAIFRTEAPIHLERIRFYISERKTAYIVPLAHTLKAECGAVGAVTAQFITDSLEKAARNNDFATSKELFDKVEEEVGKAISELPGNSKAQKEESYEGL